jgi:hypothetical protein
MQVDEFARRAGKRAICIPQFHCECNLIEYMWGLLKQDVRVRNFMIMADRKVKV